MKKLQSLLFFLAFVSISYAQHTFSIVAIDPATGKIGSAGATCLSSADCGGCGGAVIISDIVPGKGAINAQATVCIPNTNLSNGIQQVDNGLNATEALSWLEANDGCQFGNIHTRQYGIVTINESNEIDVAGYTGLSCLNEANHILGPNYSIQGNILISEDVLGNMENGFVNTIGTFEEKMMGAMQGANIPGADSRCLSDGISSKSSFLRIAHPDDEPGDFSIDLVVPATLNGADPIDSLQTLFDELIVINTNSILDDLQVNLFPNPTADYFILNISTSRDVDELELKIFDMSGQEMMRKMVDNGSNEIEFDTAVGLYIYQLRNKNRELLDQGSFVIQ